MNANALKSWKMDSGVLVSPRLRDKRELEQYRKFLVRYFIHGDYDERSFIVKINTKGDAGKANLEKLRKLGIVAA